jgi:hypothetical protein
MIKRYVFIHKHHVSGKRCTAVMPTLVQHIRLRHWVSCPSFPSRRETCRPRLTSVLYPGVTSEFSFSYLLAQKPGPGSTWLVFGDRGPTSGLARGHQAISTRRWACVPHVGGQTFSRSWSENLTLGTQGARAFNAALTRIIYPSWDI